LIPCGISVIESLEIVSESSDYITDINSSTFILSSPIKSKKPIIDVNKSKQILRASTIAIVEIVAELSEEVAKYLAVVIHYINNI
jgi:hypothetical protein